MKLRDAEQNYWNRYLATLEEEPTEPRVEASIAGNLDIADRLLGLYLSGSKRAGSGLVADYKHNNDPLPKVGDFWIILDSKLIPRCIVKTTRIQICNFKDVGEEVAVAEGEGDLSLEYWRKAHRDFFSPFLDVWGIKDLDTAEVLTEFYDVVFIGNIDS